MRMLRRYADYRRTHRWVRWAQDAVLLLIVFGGGLLWQTRNLVSSGEPAPPFVLRDLDGRTWSLADLRGKQVALHFWAPWCGVCAAESGTLSAFHKSAGDDVVVLSVALAYDDPAQVTAFTRKHQVDYPVLLGNDALMRAYKIDAFPTTYLLSREGAIEHASVGYTTRLGLWLRLWL